MVSYAADPAFAHDEKKKAAFSTFGGRSNGTLDAWGLRLAMEALHFQPTDEDIDKAVSTLGDKATRRLDYGAFIGAVLEQKRKEQSAKKDSDLLGAFVAMGGKSDKTGKVNVAALGKVLKEEFNLTFKPDELLLAMERDDQVTEVKEIDFAKFAYIFGQ